MRLHVWNLSSSNVARYPDRARAVYNFVTAVAVLKRIEVIANLPVTSVRIDCFIFVEARNGPHRVRLHGVVLLMLSVLGMVILMAVDNHR